MPLRQFSEDSKTRESSGHFVSEGAGKSEQKRKIESQTGTKKHIGSEKDSNSESESESESESSDSEPVLVRPVFKRTQPSAKKPVTSNASSDRKSSTLDMFQNATQVPVENSSSKIDDRDDIDPKAEYLEWITREKRRMEEEHEQFAAIEREYEMKMERREQRLLAIMKTQNPISK